MYIAVTGASGFIGSHVVAALNHRDHEVRCLVRNVDKTAAALQMHGLGEDDSIDIVEADLTDTEALKAGLDGVDGVVHVAALFSLNPNDAAKMAALNPGSVDTIISLAGELGLAKVVYVSTMGVYVPTAVDHVDADTPLSAGCGPYTESKIAAEKVARAAVAAGAPVVSVYPGGVLGPNDPNPDLSDSQGVLRDALKGKIPFLPKGASIPIVDVRDVAMVCAGAVDGGAHSRYLVPGESVAMTDLWAQLGAITKRKIKLRDAPSFVFVASGKISDAVARITKKKMAVTDESVKMLLDGAANNHVTYGWAPAQDDFGVPAHDWKDTVRDAVTWMYAAGHITDKDAGGVGER